jgi:hypothetical protein
VIFSYLSQNHNPGCHIKQGESIQLNSAALGTNPQQKLESANTIALFESIAEQNALGFRPSISMSYFSNP